MPLDTNNAFKQETRKRATQPIFLYTIYDFDNNGTNKYFAAYDINVTFGDPPVEYEKFPITHDVITENTSGEIDSTKVQLSNISRLIEYYLQSYDLRGKKVSIKMVFANLLDDSDAYVEFSNYIDSYSSNVKDVIFNLMSKFDILGVMLPGRIFIKSHCQWIFPIASVWVTDTIYALGTSVRTNNISYKCLIAHTSGVFATDLAAGKWVMTECGYGGTEITCNKTRSRCRELGNQLRFGAFPSAPGGTSYA